MVSNPPRGDVTWLSISHSLRIVIGHMGDPPVGQVASMLLVAEMKTRPCVDGIAGLWYDHGSVKSDSSRQRRR